MTPRTAAITAVCAALVAGVVAAGPSAATTRGSAPGVRAVTVAEPDQPVGFTFTPAGRIVYLERATGAVRLLDPASGSDRRWGRITGVDSDGERGALGVALHPRWPRVPAVYVFASRTPAGGTLRNQVLRLRIRRGRIVDREVLLSSPIGSRANHNGGRIAFGPDGRLYVVIGDGGEDPATAQTLDDEPRGKILRLEPDGSVPADNPFGTSVWSYGHRNSIGFAFDPRTGRLWESENGPECNDELNRIVEGGNFAWGPSQDCESPPASGDTNRDGPDPKRLPQNTFADPVAVTGVAFCEGCGLGRRYEGALLAGCANGECKATVGPVMYAQLADGRWSLAGPPAEVPMTGHDGAVYSMEVAPGGRIYFSDGDGIYRLAPRRG
jgi:glucose/arabinose dehydrogenase